MRGSNPFEVKAFHGEVVQGADPKANGASADERDDADGQVQASGIKDHQFQDTGYDNDEPEEAYAFCVRPESEDDNEQGYDHAGQRERIGHIGATG